MSTAKQITSCTNIIENSCKLASICKACDKWRIRFYNKRPQTYVQLPQFFRPWRIPFKPSHCSSPGFLEWSHFLRTSSFLLLWNCTYRTAVALELLQYRQWRYSLGAVGLQSYYSSITFHSVTLYSVTGVIPTTETTAASYMERKPSRNHSLSMHRTPTSTGSTLLSNSLNVKHSRCFHCK